MVRAYDKRVIPGRVGGMTMASEDRGLYQLRTVNGAPFARASRYGRHKSFGDALILAFRMAVRAVMAVSVLLAWVIGEFLYRDTPVTVMGVGAGWLTLAHLLVPIGFFCIFLSNRRYGPGLAFVQLAATAATVVGFAALVGDDIHTLLPSDAIPPLREAVAFGSAFFGAALISITVFDGARGPRWWTAPFFGFLSAAILFAVIFFPALYAGTGRLWLFDGLEYMALLAGEGLCLLIPFWTLRRMLPPMGGLGGY